MRRVSETTMTREDCLHRSLEYEWLAENSPSPAGAAQGWDQARWWRSQALIAKPETATPPVGTQA